MRCYNILNTEGKKSYIDKKKDGLEYKWNSPQSESMLVNAHDESL